MKNLRSCLLLVLFCLGIALEVQAADDISSLIEQFLSSRRLQVVKCEKLEGQTTCSAMAAVRGLERNNYLHRVLALYRTRTNLASVYHNVDMRLRDSLHTQVVAVSHYLADGLNDHLNNPDLLLQALSAMPNIDNSLLASIIQRLVNATSDNENKRIIIKLLNDIRLALDQFSPEDIAFLVALTTEQSVLLVDASQENQITAVELQASEGQLIVTPVSYDLNSNNSDSLAEVIQAHLENTQVHFLMMSDHQLLPVVQLTPHVVQSPCCEDIKPAILTDIRMGTSRQLVGVDGRGIAPRGKVKSRHYPRLNKGIVRNNIRGEWENWKGKAAHNKSENGYSKIKIAAGIGIPMAVITSLALSEGARNSLWHLVCGQETEYGQCLYDVAGALANQIGNAGSAGYQAVCGEMNATECSEYYSRKFISK